MPEQCDFLDIFGGYFFENNESTKFPNCQLLDAGSFLRIVKKIYSVVILIIFIILHYYYRRKYGPNYYENLLSNSIFSIFTVSASPPSSIFETSSSSLRMFQYKAKVYKTTYIIDFFSCFCLFFNMKCIEIIYSPIKRLYDKFSNKCSEIFLNNIQYSAFYLVNFGMVFLIPLEHLLSVMISPCLARYTTYIYFILDAIMASCGIFICVFIFSFLSIRREIISIDPKDTLTRQAFLLYHLRKALLFAFALLVFKIVIMILTGTSYLEVGEDPETSIYWIGKNMFLLGLVKTSSAKIIQIRNDCCFLKEESRFYLIESFLNKITLIPQSSLVKHLKEGYKKKMNPIEWAKTKLKQENANNLEKFKEEIRINDEQIFKNILRTNGVYSFIPVWLLYYIFFDCICSILLSLLSILVFKFNVFQEDGCNLGSLIIMGFVILDLLECSLFPYLIYLVTQKKNIFGDELTQKKNVEVIKMKTLIGTTEENKNFLSFV